ncbi:Gfo/Idh/MocA family oxidoreductase [Nitrosopumilus sp.]|jgi:predicted dehydrogenase|nr:Gfo/Idh/MocA family oxidoreductase [Nitrosopumilus sp.]|tara:strand:+ start:1270 stop:2271 length:1002 start_codon:yes stop_codon:yes gene_type:complete
MTKIKIGIIGCSTIAKNSTIPAILNSNNVELEQIGSRSNDKAFEFSKIFNCEQYGNYDDVINNKNIDCVYISTPVGNHEEWVLKAAEAGKHVLCEKSSTISFDSAKKMVKICKENNVRLMEGFMFRFHPSHKKVKKCINDKVIGKIFLFSSKYGFPPISKDNIRYDKFLGGGILNDAGCYPINASRMLFESEPKGVFCNLTIDKETQVDTKATFFMDFDGGIQSQSSVGYDLGYQSNYRLWGSDGSLNLSRSYNIPPDMPAKLNIKSSSTEEEILIEPVNHFKLMIESFCDEIIKSNSCNYNFEEDLLNQAKVMEACRVSNNEKRYVEIKEIK